MLGRPWPRYERKCPQLDRRVFAGRRQGLSVGRERAAPEHVCVSGKDRAGINPAQVPKASGEIGSYRDQLAIVGRKGDRGHACSGMMVPRKQ